MHCPRLLFLACCLFIALARDCAAAPAVRIGEVMVRQGNGGVPCFSISEREEARAGAPDFHSITVSEAGPGAKNAMWSMAMPRQRTFPVSFRMCVPYAGRLPVLPQTPAAPLQPGRVYEVAIEPRGPLAAAAPRSYRGRFCVGAAGPGAPAVRAAIADARGRYMCASPSGS